MLLNIKIQWLKKLIRGDQQNLIKDTIRNFLEENVVLVDASSSCA